MLKHLVLKDRLQRAWNRNKRCGLSNKDVRRWEDAEYQVSSQNGEDGLLDYIFSRAGVKYRTFLEFGFGPAENNSLRLIAERQFEGAFIDGSELNCNVFNSFARERQLAGTKAAAHFITAENLPGLVDMLLGQRELDLLSIDVDGNDYWLLKAIIHRRLRVLVIEYNASLGPDVSWTIPYRPEFERLSAHKSGFYCGASLAALASLADQANVGLVGCDSSGVNAFFVARELIKPPIVEVSVASAFRPHRARLNHGWSRSDQWNMIKDLEWLRV
jgi:hypothetical protein